MNINSKINFIYSFMERNIMALSKKQLYKEINYESEDVINFGNKELTVEINNENISINAKEVNLYNFQFNCKKTVAINADIVNIGIPKVINRYYIQTINNKEIKAPYDFYESNGSYIKCEKLIINAKKIKFDCVYIDAKEIYLNSKNIECISSYIISNYCNANAPKLKISMYMPHKIHYEYNDIYPQCTLDVPASRPSVFITNMLTCNSKIIIENLGSTFNCVTFYRHNKEIMAKCIEYHASSLNHKYGWLVEPSYSKDDYNIVFGRRLDISIPKSYYNEKV